MRAYAVHRARMLKGPRPRGVGKHGVIYPCVGEQRRKACQLAKRAPARRQAIG